MTRQASISWQALWMDSLPESRLAFRLEKLTCLLSDMVPVINHSIDGSYALQKDISSLLLHLCIARLHYSPFIARMQKPCSMSPVGQLMILPVPRRVRSSSRTGWADWGARAPGAAGGLSRNQAGILFHSVSYASSDWMTLLHTLPCSNAPQEERKE